MNTEKQQVPTAQPPRRMRVVNLLVLVLVTVATFLLLGWALHFKLVTVPAELAASQQRIARSQQQVVTSERDRQRAIKQLPSATSTARTVSQQVAAAELKVVRQEQAHDLSATEVTAAKKVLRQRVAANALAGGWNPQTRPWLATQPASFTAYVGTLNTITGISVSFVARDDQQRILAVITAVYDPNQQVLQQFSVYPTKVYDDAHVGLS